MAPSVNVAVSPQFPLCNDILGLEKQRELALDLTIPTYSRSCEGWIVHIGMGGFHRAHQAVYTDRLLHLYAQQPEDRPSVTYGICGMGLRPRQNDKDPGDELIAQACTQQDGMYTLMVCDEDGIDASVIGSVMDYILVPGNYDAAVQRLARPDTHIISMTVTEKGYYMDSQGNLNVNHCDIRRDLNYDAKSATPVSTLYGLLSAGLTQRMKSGTGGCTILSCDNIVSNGDTVKRLLIQFLELSDSCLAKWVKENVTFPNSMVDRITPAVEDHHKELARSFGVEDQWPVVTERFTQWVIEDKFACGRPEWEKVGAQLVKDAKPYELMKLRLLNGPHASIAILGHLAGHVSYDSAMSDPNLAGFVLAYDMNILPTVPQIPGTDFHAYAASVCKRMSNTFIKDKLSRMLEDASQRFTNTAVDPILELYAMGQSADWVAISIAALIQFMSRINLSGDPIPAFRDPMIEKLQEPCRVACTTHEVYVPIQLVLGDKVASLTPFVSSVATALQEMQTKGVQEMIRDRLAQI